jgi:starch phosphorylase
MAQLTPRFSSNRSVCDYTEQHYLPAAHAYCERAANQGAVGQRLVAWQRALEQHWGSLRFGHVRVETGPDEHWFEVEVLLGGVDPSALRVELYAEALDGAGLVRQAMQRTRVPADPGQPCVYEARVPAARPAKDYTARVVPERHGVAVPLEFDRILWQR